MKNKTMLTLALCALAVCAVSRPGYAALPSPRIPGMDYIALADAVPLSSDEMGNLRGGFIDPTGLIYNFAVNVQTALNGAEVFTRSLNISPSGPNGQMQATSTSSLLPKNIPSGFNVGVIGNGTGVTVSNTSGNVATFLNQTAAGAPASIIISTGSGLNAAQSVNATLTLRNISSIARFVHSMAPQTAAMAQHTALRSLGF